MDRYLVLVWAKDKQKCPPINLTNKFLGMYEAVPDVFNQDEIWVVVRAKNTRDAAQKAKILWELT